MPAKRSSAARRRKKPREKASSPPRPSTRRARAKGGTSDGKRESQILAHLGPENARIALSIFAERHPELVPELEGIIREVGAGVAFEDVANKVVAASAELTMFDLAQNHSADQFHYKGETETAWDVFEETMAPFVEDLDRLARMGLIEAASQQCQGVLLGLYRAEHERVSEVIDWIPDGVPELADAPLRALGPVRRRRVGSGSLTVGKALKQFARENLPDWGWLQG